MEIAQKWINDLFVDNQLTDFQENQYSIVLVDKFASILKTNFQPLLMNTLPDMLFHAYIQSIPGNLFDPKNLECRLIPYHSINPYHQFLENVSIQTGYKDILQMLNDCGGWLIHWISIQLRYPVSKNHGSWEIFKALGVTFGLISLTIESENERNLIQLMRDGLEEVLLLWCDYSRPKDGYYSNDQALICVAILDVLYAVMGVLNRMNNEPKVIENTNINEEE